METQQSSEIVNPDLSVAVHILVTGGFILEDVIRNPGYALFLAYRFDEFGARHRYCFVLAETTLKLAQVEAAKIAAGRHKAELVVRGQSEAEVVKIDWPRFINLFGGPVLNTAPLDPTFAEELIKLGRNQLPERLQGEPNDLFEIYVQVALEFILGGRVFRYGQKRRFEARADGILLPGLQFAALYDAKAYSEGYIINTDSIRQFKSYVEDFSRRYQAYLPNLSSFIVISGDFPQTEQQIGERSRDLYNECHVPLSCFRAASLAEIIKIVSGNLKFRRSIVWSRIFADPLVQTGKIVNQVEAIRKDQIIQG